MNPANLNTPQYWNAVYQQEWESGSVLGGNYHRDYGPIHEAVIGLIPNGSAVLDIACGAGVLCRKIKLSLPGARVLGVDFAEFTIQQNRERDLSLGVEYRCVDIRNSLGSMGGQFDAVGDVRNSGAPGDARAVGCGGDEFVENGGTIHPDLPP